VIGEEMDVNRRLIRCEEFKKIDGREIA